MSIRELRTFLAIADGGSFAVAAMSVGRTHSAVSVQMKALEDEFGVSLFDRSHRPPRLTPAGRAFLLRAIEAVAAYDHLFRAASNTQIEGYLRLGVVPSVITGAMPRALAALRERYPALHVELAMGLSRELVGRVQNGSIDAAVVSDFRLQNPALRWSVIIQEPLVLIAPTSAAARKAEDVVSSYPFIRYSRHAWVGELIEEFLRERKIQVNETMSLDTLEAIRAMVHHGLGVSVVPQRAGEDNDEQPVRTLRFSGSPWYRTLGIVALVDGPKQALLEVLLEVLELEFGTSPRGRGRGANPSRV